MDPAEEAKEMSRVPGCAATIVLDWLSATFLQERFECVVQAESWSLFPITRDIHFGIKLSSCVAHSNMCFAGKMTETLQGTGLGFPVFTREDQAICQVRTVCPCLLMQQWPVSMLMLQMKQVKTREKMTEIVKTPGSKWPVQQSPV